MISKINATDIEPNEQNFIHLVDKYNLLAEAYRNAVLSASVSYELYENSYLEESHIREENARLHVQLKNMAKIESIEFNS
ncbi:hypothetical protein EMA8858_00522 [Emticicia aquatica]|uniref:Uncharacterized protein n=1 Tax=Emticicia aquatica TaxID=1681835 RepID=A0ABN8ES72_9BACT|nr:hypothetical protein [Emticicia aquatica]CAH0994413.1 hypothetical protein EMA8858_00522 [Emticicia aquatica]